jgi:hypothetical protein
MPVSDDSEPGPDIDCADLLGIMQLQLKLKKKQAVLPPDCVVEVQRTRKADATPEIIKLDHVRLVNTEEAIYLWGQDPGTGEISVVRIPWSSVHYVPGPLPQVYETETELISVEPRWLEELIR